MRAPGWTRPRPRHMAHKRWLANAWLFHPLLQCTDTDFTHWSRLPGFGRLHTEVVRHGGRCPCESRAVRLHGGVGL